MKNLYLVVLLLLGIGETQGQFIKKLGDKIKNDAEWRVRNKADREISRGIDSLIEVSKKVVEKKKKSNDISTNNIGDQTEKKPDNAAIAGAKTNKLQPEADDDLTPKDGFVTLTLSSDRIFAGGSVLISGQGAKYKNFLSVEVSVSGTAGTNTRLITLNPDGKFLTTWYAPDKEGVYIVSVKGSDGKGLQKANIIVYALPLIQNWCTENIELTKKAYDKLAASAEQVKSKIGAKDKGALEEKMADITAKNDKVLKLLNDLNTAAKDIASFAKAGKNLSPNLSGNLSELNIHLAEQRKKMRQIEEYNDHQPAENTICEYLVMLNEACAAFSVYTNLESRALVTIIGNIQLDKGVPKAVSMVNEQKQWLSEPNDFAIKEPAKIFATAALDAKSLSSALGVAGFAGDMVQFATDFLLKKYCGVFKGEFQHDYSIEFRNSKGENWWTYGVGMKAVITLRYPKINDGVNIIKMKGNIEGNGTRFTFFEDVEKDDEFQKGTKGKIEVVPIKTFTPLAVSFATSQRDILGFGAIARGLATPAYFNLAIDAEYDVNANKIKLFVNQALVDFTVYVSNKFVFALVGADLLPYIKQMNFPIHPALTTVSSVLRGNNEFDVTKDSKGNLSFTGKANKHLGSKASKIEHDLNFSLAVNKE